MIAPLRIQKTHIHCLVYSNPHCWIGRPWNE